MLNRFANKSNVQIGSGRNEQTGPQCLNLVYMNEINDTLFSQLKVVSQLVYVNHHINFVIYKAIILSAKSGS